MAQLEILEFLDSRLRTVAKPVDPAQVTTPEFQALLDDMFETMHEYQGVGLAAPQVHESLRVFVAGFAPDEEEEASPRGVPLMALINPEITPIGTDLVDDWEGCLSIPDIRGRVPRARQIVVRGFERSGKKMELRASGFTARVIQHETDHLDGVLFFDRMRSFETLTFLEEYQRYWRDADDDPDET